MNRRRSLYKYYEMTPGTYVAFVKITGYNKADQDHEVNLAIYSEFVCKIGLASREQAIKFAGNSNIEWNYDPKKQVNVFDQIRSESLVENSGLYPGAVYSMKLRTGNPDINQVQHITQNQQDKPNEQYAINP